MIHPTRKQSFESKFTWPLALTVIGTGLFILAPIKLGFGMTMHAAFLGYALGVLAMSCLDRRAMGYAAVLSVCNPANDISKISYSFLMVLLCLLVGYSNIPGMIQILRKRNWWLFSVAALAFVVPSIVFWYPSLSVYVTEVKHIANHLGYLVLLPLAVGLTIKTLEDGVRLMGWLCFMAVATIALFHFFGVSGLSPADDLGFSREGLDAVKQIGNIFMNFLRTQVCIPIAALAAGSLALGIGRGVTLRAVPFVLISAVCVYMLIQVASTGSAFAMICGMAVLVVAYLAGRPTIVEIFTGVSSFCALALTLFLVVFTTDNYLLSRIIEKRDQGGIDRIYFWKEGVEHIVTAPIGNGWSLKGQAEWAQHSDFLVYFNSYGWATGFCYLATVVALMFSMWRIARTALANAARVRTLAWVSLTVITVYVVNSVLDMLSSNAQYYQTVWALILVPAAVLAVVTDKLVPTHRRF